MKRCPPLDSAHTAEPGAGTGPIERARAIDTEIDRHWATAVLTAVRQDDAVAFGIDRLRAAGLCRRPDYGAGLPPTARPSPRPRARCRRRARLRQSRAEFV